ncbi:MAG: hypothetical protein ABSG88_17995 [Bradyrhizobium sp.]|jgi:hypothetical protein
MADPIQDVLHAFAQRDGRCAANKEAPAIGSMEMHMINKKGSWLSGFEK